jgi:hypothetical protein
VSEFYARVGLLFYFCHARVYPTNVQIEAIVLEQLRAADNMADLSCVNESLLNVLFPL